MKKLFLVVLLLYLNIPLFAQTRQDTSIFVPFVTGRGGGIDDPIYFSNMLNMEVASRGYAIGETRLDSDFILTGSLAPFLPPQVEDDEEPPASLFLLHLTLVDLSNGLILVEQDLLYETAEKTGDYLSLLIFNMLANIPMSKIQFVDTWRNNWLYFDAIGYWSPRVYSDAEKHTASAAIHNFGGGIASELHFQDYVSAETGLEITSDSVIDNKETYRSLMLEIPFLLKLVFKPALTYMLEPYGGVQYNFPFTPAVAPSEFSWLMGFQYGVQAGPGCFFIDYRFIVDMDKIRLQGRAGDVDRNFFKLCVGYKYGIFPRK